MALSTALPDFLSISEVDDGPFFAGALFQRKFGGAPPSDPHHLVCFYRAPVGTVQAVCYAHFRPFGDIILVGGVCTDGEVLRRLPSEQREALAALGSLYFQVLKYGFAQFAGRCEAYFGYCGDPRAEQVNLQAGFSKTEHAHLLVNFHKLSHPVMQRALIAKAAAIGPF
ncbi:MAG: hypothetical protein ACT4NL_09430 [Pseudomarimonas sp.]